MSNIKYVWEKTKTVFPTILHNKQLKFGLLVPVGLLMHEQSQKKRSSLHTQSHHRKGAAQKMNINQK